MKGHPRGILSQRTRILMRAGCSARYIIAVKTRESFASLLL